jgi:hypothetical protein
VCLAYLLYKAYDIFSMGEVNALWAAISVILILIMSVNVWGEKITERELVGVSMVIVGICILLYKNIKDETARDLGVKINGAQKEAPRNSPKDTPKDSPKDTPEYLAYARTNDIPLFPIRKSYII